VVPPQATAGDIADAQHHLDTVAAQAAGQYAEMAASESSSRQDSQDSQNGTADCMLTTTVACGAPADLLLDLAEAEGDLLVIATHGPAGVARWVLGSVADALVQAVRVPILLIRG
jgi:nucleotide-binding universal stress UspA family protein